MTEKLCSDHDLGQKRIYRDSDLEHIYIISIILKF